MAVNKQRESCIGIHVMDSNCIGLMEHPLSVKVMQTAVEAGNYILLSSQNLSVQMQVAHVCKLENHSYLCGHGMWAWHVALWAGPLGPALGR